MPRFYVNTNPQPNGDHEVHQEDICTHPPIPSNRKSLGWHSDCHSAVREAKNHYSQTNGCKYCCTKCHTS